MYLLAPTICGGADWMRGYLGCSHYNAEVPSSSQASLPNPGPRMQISGREKCLMPVQREYDTVASNPGVTKRLQSHLLSGFFPLVNIGHIYTLLYKQLPQSWKVSSQDSSFSFSDAFQCCSVCMTKLIIRRQHASGNMAQYSSMSRAKQVLQI